MSGTQAVTPAPVQLPKQSTSVGSRRMGMNRSLAAARRARSGYRPFGGDGA